MSNCVSCFLQKYEICGGGGGGGTTGAVLINVEQNILLCDTVSSITHFTSYIKAKHGLKNHTLP